MIDFSVLKIQFTEINIGVSRKKHCTNTYSRWQLPLPGRSEWQDERYDKYSSRIPLQTLELNRRKTKLLEQKLTV